MSYALWIFLKYLLQYIAFMLCTGFGRNGLWLLILFLWLFRLVYATGASMSEKKFKKWSSKSETPNDLTEFFNDIFSIEGLFKEDISVDKFFVWQLTLKGKLSTLLLHYFLSTQYFPFLQYYGSDDYWFKRKIVDSTGHSSRVFA